MELDLDLLKKDWQTNENFKQYSKEELFRMTKKKSVSIAKWLLLISILELIFWTILNNIPYDVSNVPEPPMVVTILEYIFKNLPFMLIGGLFALNYMIITEKDPKILMKRIIRMRDLIRWYIRITIAEFITIFSIGMFDGGTERINNFRENIMLFTILMIIIIVIGVIIILILRFIYKLIYGRMLKRLEENCKELEELSK